MRVVARDYLTDLTKDPRGLILVINLYDSLSQRRLNIPTVREFLMHCITVRQAQPGLSTREVFSEARFPVNGVVGSRFFRRGPKATQPPTDNRYQHVASWTTFWRHHHDLNKASREDPSGVLKQSAGLTRTQLPLAQKYLEEVISRANWCKPEASFGRPLPDPDNCWVSTGQFELAGHVPTIDAATRLRDELGLIDYGEGTVLVQYEFDAAAANASVADDVAIPTGTDGGNTRFRVAGRSKKAKLHQAAYWGSAVDLSQLSTRPRKTTGRPERVARALRLSDQRDLRAAVSGYVGCSRGDTTSDDDAAFAARLLGRRDIKKLVERLVRTVPV